MRRIVALVEVDGREVEMVFVSNNLEWSAASIVELYRCRWQIEVFFKQMKQTLQLADFLGTSANAVLWQVWTHCWLPALALFGVPVRGYDPYARARSSKVPRLLRCHLVTIWNPDAAPEEEQRDGPPRRQSG